MYDYEVAIKEKIGYQEFHNRSCKNCVHSYSEGSFGEEPLYKCNICGKVGDIVVERYAYCDHFDEG